MQQKSLPTAAVPQFSSVLEDALDVELTSRLNRSPTAAERADYRAILWAFASAIIDILDDTLSDPPRACPAPSSTHGSPASPTTSSA